MPYVFTPIRNPTKSAADNSIDEAYIRYFNRVHMLKLRAKIVRQRAKQIQYRLTSVF